VPRLRFPVVVSPVRGRWHALGVQRSGRSCEGAARAAIRLQSRRRAHSVRLGSDCADAAVDRQTCRCSWPYGVPDGDDWTWIDSERSTSAGSELARNGDRWIVRLVALE
jgi:hypothetical protein